MIPILFEAGASDFTTNGLGRLSDAISFSVTEEINGIYEVEFDYPVSGNLFDYMIENGGVVFCTHDDAGDLQPFDIYSHTTPLDEIVTFRARHISYRLNDYVVKPFTATSCASALSGIGSNARPTCPFTFYTDKTVNGNFSLTHPESARALLGGKAGSILDVYGKGEYKFDKFDVRLYVNRGQKTDVTIRYGKNLTELTREYDSSNVYGSIAPFYQSDEATVYLPELYISAEGHENDPIMVVDMSDKFDNAPTVAQLRTAAQNYLTANTPWNADNNLTINFVALWQTPEYESVAAIQRLSLGDTASLYHPDLGIVSENVKVVKVVYNVLEDRYDSIELGSVKSSLSKTLLSGTDETISKLESEIGKKPSIDALDAAIDAATQLITGGLGGHVVINRNADGEPEEILIMDTDSISTAVNVWRFNLNGLGHSHNGYNGPYNDVALTMDGKINATMIATGVLSANLIKAGVIQDEAGLNYWNMVTGELSLNAYSTTSQMNTAISASAAGVLSQAKNYTDDALSDYPTTTEMNSAIQQSADQIGISVEQKISALSIGGTNFLLNSAFTDATTGLDKWNNNGSADIYTRQADGIVCGRMRVYQKGVSGSASVSQTFYPRVKDDPAGTTYTVSGDFSVSNYSAGTDRPSLLFIVNGYYDDGGESVYTTGTLVKGSRDLSDCGFDWERREFTVRFDQRLTNAVFVVFARDCNCNLYWKDLKIEHGNTATAWSPAPEDYATTGEAAALQAQITVNATNIESKVSQTDFTGATIASKINQSASTVEIEADHINLNGIVTTNSGFAIDANGKMSANGATINGTVTSQSDDTTETATLGAGKLNIRTTSQQTNVSRSGVSIIDRDGGADSHTDITGGKIELSSLSPGTKYITLDAENGSEFDTDVTFNDSIITPLGDLSMTGSRAYVNGSATTVPSGSWKTVATITLEAGRWIIYATAQLGGTSATGYRGLVISASRDSSSRVAEWAQDRRPGISGSNVFANCMHIAPLTSQTTFYINVYQSSGADITVYGRIVAMRIA